MNLRKRRERSAIALCILLACTFPPACETFFGSTKVGQGQLYTSGDAGYDSYFEAVHKKQVAAAAWPDERREARKALVEPLGVTPTASPTTIVNAARERSGRADVKPAVEETTRREDERSMALRTVADEIDELAKKGEELKRQADNDYKNMGADKADEKKVARAREIQRELGASIDVLRSLARDARADARDSEDMLDDLADAMEGKEKRAHDRRRDSAERRRPRPAASAKAEDTAAGPPPQQDEPSNKPKPKPKATKPAEPKAEGSRPVEKPAEGKPKPEAPPPKKQESGEVFTP